MELTIRCMDACGEAVDNQKLQKKLIMITKCKIIGKKMLTILLIINFLSNQFSVGVVVVVLIIVILTVFVF